MLKQLIATALSIAAFAEFPSIAFAAQSEKPEPFKVELKNVQGESIGTAELSPAKRGVRLKLRLAKLSPGAHAIHFHEKGLCEGPDFKSAGAHLNPTSKEHGLKNPKGAHAGDMPNIKASRTGKVKTEVVAHGVTLGEGENSLRRMSGAALVIHAKADDQKTNPAGASGDRIACGVIAAVEPAPSMTIAPDAAQP